jgi:hypothetical protein
MSEHFVYQLRDPLNPELTNADFLVWIDVEPSGVAQSFGKLRAMVAATSV